MEDINRERENGLKALTTVRALLNSIGWEPRATESEEALIVDFNDEKLGISSALFKVRIEYERFICYFNFSQKSLKKYHDQVMEYITYANFGLIIGNFELNLEDGFVRFKSSIDFTHADLTEILVRNAIKSAMDNIEQYSNGLIQVMNGNKQALQAIKDAES